MDLDSGFPLNAVNRNLTQQLMGEALTSFYLVLTVVFLWPRPLWASLFLCIGLGAQLWFWREKADAAAMMGAALLGTPAEMISVASGVWTYHAPGLLWHIPVWIPLIWANLFCLFRRIAITLHRLTRERRSESSAGVRRVIFWLLGAAIIAYYGVVVFTIMKTIALVYTFFMLVAVIFWHGERDILLFLVAAVLGTFGEYLCMKLGFWKYHYPYFMNMGMPISLPMAWGLSGVIIGRIARVWEGKEENDRHDG